MFKTYSYYILKSLFSAYILSCLLFIMFFILGDLFTKFYIFFKAVQKTHTFIGFLIFSHYLALLPQIYHLLAPYIISFSTIFAILRMYQRRELLIFKSSGIALQKILGVFFLGTLFLSSTIWLNLEWLLPNWPFHGISTKLERQIHPSPLIDGKNRIFYALVYSPMGKIIPQVKDHPYSLLVVERNQYNEPFRLLQAKKAFWIEKKKQWFLNGVRIKYLGKPKFLFQRLPTFQSTFWLKTDIYPKDLESVSGLREDFLGLSSLWERYQRRKLYRIKIKLYSRLASFWTPFVLVLLGSSFLLMNQTLASLGSLLWIFLSSFLFLLSLFVFENLGMARVLPSLFAISFPYFLFTIFGLEALGKIET